VAVFYLQVICKWNWNKAFSFLIFILLYLNFQLYMEEKSTTAKASQTRPGSAAGV